MASQSTAETLFYSRASVGGNGANFNYGGIDYKQPRGSGLVSLEVADNVLQRNGYTY